MHKRSVINDFLSLIYPRFCEACSQILLKHEDQLCMHCNFTLPRSNFHLNNNNEIYLALAGRVPIVFCTSLFVFEKKGRVQKVLHSLKYKSNPELGILLGNMLGKTLCETEAHNCDVIIPIPLHKNKQRQRGYNQSEMFAKGISAALNKPVISDKLIKIEHTETQTKKKKFERWENVENVFRIENADEFYGKHILLVDDVITTGATIEAAWKAIKTINDVKISVVCIAYAEKR
ncbi:MAG: ComF family protein [Bacteroidetes bacterium]|nr:ComF family protein [Bacteroidota bacterium]